MTKLSTKKEYNMKKYITLIFAVSVLLTGCKKESEATETKEATAVEKPDEHEDPNVAHFTEEQIKTVCELTNEGAENH